MMLMALPGSIYIYQGEELGLPEVWDLPPEVLDDPVWEDSGHSQKGRDGCRVPIPWTTAGSSFGFGSNGSWLPQPDEFGAFSVEAQTGLDGSTLEMYRTAIALRKEWFEADEELTWLDLGAGVLAFQRGNGKICALNYGASPAAMTMGRIVSSSVPCDGEVIEPESCAWIDPEA
jgi:alpha-glucosidase